VVKEFFDVHGRVRWDKGHGLGGNFFVYDAEDIIIGTKKGAPLPPSFFLPLHGTMLYARPPDYFRIHPMEKPVYLLCELILSMTVPDDLVVDPFAGSGIALFAAAQLGRRYWGAELNKDAVGKEMDWYPRGRRRLSGVDIRAMPLFEETLREIRRLGRYDFRNVPQWGLEHRIVNHAKFHETHDCDEEGCDAGDASGGFIVLARGEYLVLAPDGRKYPLKLNQAGELTKEARTFLASLERRSAAAPKRRSA
jgi:hypothetical protein